MHIIFKWIIFENKNNPKSVRNNSDLDICYQNMESLNKTKISYLNNQQTLPLAFDIFPYVLLLQLFIYFYTSGILFFFKLYPNNCIISPHIFQASKF